MRQALREEAAEALLLARLPTPLQRAQGLPQAEGQRVMAYVGQTRSVKLIRRLLQHGIGECTNRGEYPPCRVPWFLDNGAFADWKAERPWDREAWLRDVSRARGHATPPDFAVAPDVVAGGVPSLQHSVNHLGELEGVPAYLAVQDGMSEADVAAVLDPFAGVFVGGTLEWKLATGAAWVEFAHRHNRPCHIGRVGTPARVRWAIEIGADSIDSCLPLWSLDQLEAFLRVLDHAPKQRRLFA